MINTIIQPIDSPIEDEHDATATLPLVTEIKTKAVFNTSRAVTYLLLYLIKL